MMEQAKPLGWNYRCKEPDLTKQQFRELVAFVDAIPRPIEVMPKDARNGPARSGARCCLRRSAALNAIRRMSARSRGFIAIYFYTA